MTRTVDETLLPRPPQVLDTPALAPATRRAAERLEQQFHLSAEAADAFAAAAVDPSEVRKAADKPEELYVPGGTVLALRTRVWTRRVMPDPRNPRLGPARRHPIAVPPGSTEAARYRPVPEPDPAEQGRPELELRIDDREHLAWASGIAKRFILKDNDWRLSIRNQGVMTEVWLSAVTLRFGDGSPPVTVPVTSEGSSRLTACHDVLDVRSADVPDTRDDRSLRSIIRALNDSIHSGPSVEQAEALRCETVPALLLVGFKPNPGSTANFATAIRSLVALRHVEPPKSWNESAKMGSIADTVLEALASAGLITPHEESWLLGLLTPEEAAAQGFSPELSVRAARIVRLLTDTDPVVHQTIRSAITGQTTRQKITNKFKLEVAAALILRSVRSGEEGDKVSDVYRGLQTGFSDGLATGTWEATYRPTGDLLSAALADVTRGGDGGPAGLELAARAAYPLIVGRQLFPDRGTKSNDQPDRRNPAAVVERMRTSAQGIRQLAQALDDHALGLRVRAVGSDGKLLTLDDGSGEQTVTDTWLRSTFPPPGRPVSPAAPETAHERYLEALADLGRALGDAKRCAERLTLIEGVDGRPMVSTEGVEPTNADAWFAELMELVALVPVWKSAHLARQGGMPTVVAWPTDDNDDPYADETDEDDDERWDAPAAGDEWRGPA